MEARKRKSLAAWRQMDRAGVVHEVSALRSAQAGRAKRGQKYTHVGVSVDLHARIQAYRERRERAAGASVSWPETLRLLIEAGLRAERGA